MHLLLAGGGTLLLLPFVWMVLTSLSPAADAGVGPWVPERFVFSNYAEVFAATPFARFLWNSLFVAAWVTFLQVLTSALAAFAFARISWPGRDRVFFLYLATMMIPGLVMIIPHYQL